MTLEELVAAARLKLDDAVLPYLWTTDELVNYANEAEREACRRANLIVDRTTAAYCRIAVVAGKYLYTLPNKILQVRSTYLGPYISGVTFSWNAATQTLADSGNGFLLAGFEEGKKITVSGFTVAANNGEFTISSVTAGSIVVGETTMTTEIAGDTVTIFSDQVMVIESTRTILDEQWTQWQRATGDPVYCLKEVNTELRLVPIPTKASTISLVVSRLPMADMALVVTPPGTDYDSPEIPDQYHSDLVYWMCKLAYEKDDSETKNLNSAAYYDNLFTSKFGDRPSARFESFRRRNSKIGQARWRPYGF